MLLLGFGNKARQGKDTAAEAIKRYYDLQNESRRRHVRSYRGTQVGLYKFAGSLYDEVNQALRNNIWKTRTVDGIKLPDWVQPDPNPEVSSIAPLGKHPKLLQWWGTELRRSQNPNYWVDKTMRSIRAELINPKAIAIITDVRFPNEADAIKSNGGYTINVQRLLSDGTQYLDPNRPVDHPSETALDNYNWDFYIKIVEPHVVLLEEQAITLCEYLKQLGPR